MAVVESDNRFIAPERIAVRVGVCRVFNEVFPASVPDSCRVNTSNSPASAEFALAPVIADVNPRVFQG